jgi:hypothetical protein
MVGIAKEKNGPFLSAVCAVLRPPVGFHAAIALRLAAGGAAKGLQNG